MPSESGEMKLLGNFSKLIELISIDPNYNPANAKIKVPALTTQKTTALAAVSDVGTQEAPFKSVTNDRQEAYEPLSGLMSRSGNMLKASGASQKIRDDAMTLSRKITGRRKTAKVKDDPNTPANEANKSHSASQLSFENVGGNFDDYIAILATEPSYAPNEPELTIAGLTAFSDNLKAKNEAVNTAFAAMSSARGQRDQLLYLNEDSVVNNALLVKAYVRAAFGPDSQLFKSIKGLDLRNSGAGARSPGAGAWCENAAVRSHGASVRSHGAGPRSHDAGSNIARRGPNIARRGPLVARGGSNIVRRGCKVAQCHRYIP